MSGKDKENEDGLDIPDFLRVPPGGREWVDPGYQSAERREAQDRSNELRAIAKKEKDDRRIAKLKAGLDRKGKTDADWAALKAGKRWDPRTARWV